MLKMLLLIFQSPCCTTCDSSIFPRCKVSNVNPIKWSLRSPHPHPGCGPPNPNPPPFAPEMAAGYELTDMPEEDFLRLFATCLGGCREQHEQHRYVAYRATEEASESEGEGRGESDSES